ncbi:TetR/AcrR family transcriptional regulator [Inquilinus limosus]|uniref:TetR/AcrR family transcriptional regulator n=1 Tax=Inquilinus limosus TaxID=171674 RepID=UPI003F1650AA
MTETASGNTRKRSYDPEGMRRRLLDVAAEAFQSRGFQATGMHELMREAGVTGGALYHHFPTKKALGLAVIHDRVAREVEETWIEPVRAAPDALQGIAGVFERIAAGLRQRGAVAGCPLNNLALELSLADPEFRAATQAVFEAWRTAIAERLRVDQAAGRVAATDADDLAAFVVAAYSGAMAQAKAQQDAAPLEACARQLMRCLEGLRTGP